MSSDIDFQHLVIPQTSLDMPTFKIINITNFIQELKLSCDEYNKIRDDYNNLKLKNHYLQDTNEKLFLTIDNMKIQYSELETKLNEHIIEIQQLNKSILEKQQYIDYYNTQEMTKLFNSKMQLLNNYKILQTNYSSLFGTYNKLLTSTKNNETNIKNLEDEINILKTKNNILTTQNNDLIDKNNNFQNEISKLILENQQLPKW